MHNCIVVFDTNSYRQFATKSSEEVTKKHISNLKKLEKARNIQAVLATDVAIELYSHLKDLNDPEYEICKNSIIAQHLHTLKNGSPNYILNSDVHLCYVLFGKLPDFSVNEQKKVLKMSQFLYKNSAPESLEVYTKNFTGISNFHKDKKLEYINHLIKFNEDVKEQYRIIEKGTPEEKAKAQKTLDETKEDLDGDFSIQLLANGFLERATSTLNINLESLSKEEKDEKIEIIKKQFLVPIIFHRNISRGIFQNPFDFKPDKPEVANSYLDYQLSFHISNYVDDKQIIFVTNEKKFFRAAKETGNENRVVNLKYYLEDLGYDTNFMLKK